MPLTFAHPAIVLPLAYVGLPVSALAAGAMAPDLPLFVHDSHGYHVTHSWSGVVTVDVALGLALVAVWWFVLRDPMVALAPDVVRRRLAAHVSIAPSAWVLAVPAVVIGAASHVTWDLFTHAHRWGTAHVTWLHHEHLGVLGATWAQYTSGVAGLTVEAVVAWRWIASRPVAEPDGRSGPHPRAVLALVVAAALVVGVPVVVANAGDVHDMAFRGFTAGTAAGPRCSS